MALALLRPETASGQGFSAAFSNAYREALEDTAVKFEYLKPKARECDLLVSSLRSSLTSTQLSYRFYRESVSIQAKVDSTKARERRKIERKNDLRKGRKQGAALVLLPPLAYLILKSFF